MQYIDVHFIHQHLGVYCYIKNKPVIILMGLFHSYKYFLVLTVEIEQYQLIFKKRNPNS